MSRIKHETIEEQGVISNKDMSEIRLNFFTAEPCFGRNKQACLDKKKREKNNKKVERDARAEEGRKAAIKTKERQDAASKIIRKVFGPDTKYLDGAESMSLHNKADIATMLMLIKKFPADDSKKNGHSFAKVFHAVYRLMCTEWRGQVLRIGDLKYVIKIVDALKKADKNKINSVGRCLRLFAENGPLGKEESPHVSDILFTLNEIKSKMK